jgi:hypothetical protein
MSVEAYVFITTTNPGPRKACQAVRRLPGVVRADASGGGGVVGWPRRFPCRAIQEVLVSDPSTPVGVVVIVA